MSKAISRKPCKIRPRVRLMTNRKSYLQRYHFRLSKVTPNRGSGPPIWGTVYTLEVNGSGKVKSNAQTPCRFFSLRGWLGRTVPQLIFPNCLHISVQYILCKVKFKGISVLFPVHWLFMDKRK